MPGLGSSCLNCSSPLEYRHASTATAAEGFCDGPACQLGYYELSALPPVCVRCNLSCLSCQTDAQEESCTACSPSCTDHRVLQEKVLNSYVGYCLQNCSDGYYETFNGSFYVCEKCGDLCRVCVNGSACTECMPVAYLYENLTCIAACDTAAGYYVVDRNCLGTDTPRPAPPKQSIHSTVLLAGPLVALHFVARVYAHAIKLRPVFVARTRVCDWPIPTLAGDC